MICITPKELMMMMMKGLSISDIFTTNFWHAQMLQKSNFWLLLLLLLQPKQERKKASKQASKQSHLN